MAFSRIYQRGNYLYTYLFILRREEILSVLSNMPAPTHMGPLSTGTSDELNGDIFYTTDYKDIIEKYVT